MTPLSDRFHSSIPFIFGKHFTHFVVFRPEEFSQTERISLVSSFFVSLFLGRHAPIDQSGLNNWQSGMKMIVLFRWIRNESFGSQDEGITWVLTFLLLFRHALALDILWESTSFSSSSSKRWKVQKSFPFIWCFFRHSLPIRESSYDTSHLRKLLGDPIHDVGLILWNKFYFGCRF